jgi:predicted Fe-S protein YdhL (DUF1289 family)
MNFGDHGRVSQLTAMQSAAWHSADDEEREHVRAEVRAAAVRAMAPHDAHAVILDVDGREIERVEASRQHSEIRPPSRTPRPARPTVTG